MLFVSQVTSRIGEPIHGYGVGHDYGDLGEGSRNYFEHVHLKDKDGNLRLRYSTLSDHIAC